MTVKITQKNALNVPDGRHPMGSNLYLWVRGNGKYRTFIFRYVLSGRRRDVSLGSPTFKSIKQAREEAKEFLAMLSRGIDPKEELDRRIREAAERIEIKTFKQFAESVAPEIQAIRRYKSETTVPFYMSFVRRFAYPYFGNKKISDVTSNDVLESLTPIWETKTRAASMYRSFLEMLFTYARKRGIYTRQNPATWKGNLDAWLPSESKVRTVKHFRAATLEQAKEIARTCVEKKAAGYKCLLIAILTASRANEVTLLQWSEINFEEGVISIPPERRKDGKPYPHRIPISRQVAKILNDIPRDEESDYVFTTRRGMPYPRLAYRVLRLLTTDFTVHGFRSTFRDWAAEHSVPSNVAEKCLMHAVGTEVEQAYQRSDLLELRRPVMQAWADAVLPDL